MTAVAPMVNWAQPGPNGGGPTPAAARFHAIVAGCHGGAGTSTIAWLLNRTVAAHDASTALGRPGSLPLLVVARGHIGGAITATSWMNRAAGIGVIPAVLIVVGDGVGPEPKPATLRFRLLEARTRHGIVRFPYVPRWRYEHPQPGEVLPKKAREALAAIERSAAPALRS